MKFIINGMIVITKTLFEAFNELIATNRLSEGDYAKVKYSDNKSQIFRIENKQAKPKTKVGK